jgi:hypothetical protein
MKQKVFLFTIAAASTGIFSLHAQTDMTSYIQDADVATGEPWSNTRTNNGEQFDGAPDAYYLDMWSDAAYSYDSHQDITGLPNGLYTLTAAVRSNDATFVLFAATTETEFTAVIPNTGNSGNELGNGWQYLSVENIEVKDGALTIGVKGDGAAGVWVSVDVFRLYLYSLDALKNVLQEKVTDAETNLTGKKMQSAVAAELTAAIAQAKTAIAGDSEDAMTGATLRLNTAMEAAKLSINSYTSLEAAIAEAETDAQSAGIGVAELNEAIATATAVYTQATAGNEDVAGAISALKKVLWEYRFENTTGEQPLDVTELIANPDFDNGNTGWSWTTGAQNAGTFVAETKTEFQNAADYPNGYGDFKGNVWENWNASAYTGKMYQRLTGLSNGRYTLSATVFSNTVKTDEAGEVVDPQDWLFLYANEGETSVTSPNLMLTYSVTGYVNDGTMEIGINIKEAVGNWFGIDNFKLLFTGYDQNVAIAYLQERLAVASALENAMQASAWTELQAAITQGNAAVTTPSKAALSEAVLRLNSAITAAEASLAAYTSLADAIAAANAGKADYADFPGYTAFVTAIASAQGQYDGKQLDAEGIEAAIAALQRADMLCRLTQQGENVDVTFVLQNPSFEKDVYKEDKAYNSPDGWILDIDYTSGSPDAVIQTDEPFDGTNVFNIWSGTLKSIDLYQETDVLPPGLYSLSAMLRTELEQVNGTQMVYALVDGMTRYESDLAYEFPELVFSESWETQDAWMKLTAEFYFETPGSTVRLGAHSEGDGESSAGWFQVDAFELILKERSEVAIHTSKTADNAVNVRSVKGGVNITTSAATPVHIYAITGQLVKTATVNGKSFVPLLRGIYIINHQKVIVIN